MHWPYSFTLIVASVYRFGRVRARVIKKRWHTLLIV